MMVSIKALTVILLLTVFCTISIGQPIIDSVSVIPGKHYAAGTFQRMFLGSGYRSIWTTAVKVPVLNLDTFAGGLKAQKRGGGLQTNSLRFEGKDGRIYVFRTVDKFPGRALPPELKGTILETLGKDQVSLMLPFGAQIVCELADKVGVMQAKPYYCVMPDDPRLGEYLTDFAGSLGSVEERPDEGPENSPGFAGSKKIVNSHKFSAALDSDTDERIDAASYLEARLLDILVGDWDRHADQWRWSRSGTKKQGLWKPIARDRDFSFVVYDGFIPFILDQRWANRDIDGYNKDKPDMINLEHKSRFMDVRFLNGLKWQDWQNTVKNFQDKLSDDAIESAVNILPGEIKAITGPDLIAKLKNRRDMLDGLAREYYEIVSKFVDIQTSNKSEFVTIDRKENGDIGLTIAKKNSKGNPFYSRIFSSKETEELRLYLLDGNDIVEAQGAKTDGITVRIIGGKGKDRLIEKSDLKGIHFYDSFGGVDLNDAKNAMVDIDEPENAHERPQLGYPESRLTRSLQGEELRPPYDYGYVSMPLPYFGYNIDNGFYLGAGMERTFYRFRADPFASRIMILSDYSFGTGAFYLRYEGDYRAFVPGTRMRVKLKTAIPGDKPNFYGYGNTTLRDENREDEDYYRAEINIATAEVDISKTVFRHTEVFSGFDYQFIKTEIEDSALVYTSPDYLMNTKHTLGLVSGVLYDSRDHEVAPLHGIYFLARAGYYPAWFDNDHDFVKLQIEGKTFITLLDRLTVALHANAEKLDGKFPFYHAAYVGGSGSVRGYNRNRFAGDTGIIGNAEFRLFLARKRIIFPTDIGLFTYADAGRTWFEGESPGDWHHGLGGGIYFAPLMRDFTVSGSVARSPKGTQIYLDLGFAF